MQDKINRSCYLQLLLSMHTIAVLAAMQPATGNRTTALRICDCFRGDNFSVIPCDITDSNTAVLQAAEADVIVALHAWRAGRLVVDGPAMKIPLIVVLGGTDINHDVSDAQRLQVCFKGISNTCMWSHYVATVVFSRSWCRFFKELLEW